MTLAKAVELAKAEKKKPGQKNIRFVICHSPMEVKAGENRDFDGAPDNPEEDYGYCPEELVVEFKRKFDGGPFAVSRVWRMSPLPSSPQSDSLIDMLNPPSA